MSDFPNPCRRRSHCLTASLEVLVTENGSLAGSEFYMSVRLIRSIDDLHSRQFRYMDRTMNRLLVFLLLLVMGPATDALADRPNILWIIVDDMSANFSCYGEKTIETPNVDALAKRGTMFTNART